MILLKTDILCKVYPNEHFNIIKDHRKSMSFDNNRKIDSLWLDFFWTSICSPLCDDLREKANGMDRS